MRELSIMEMGFVAGGHKKSSTSNNSKTQTVNRDGKGNMDGSKANETRITKTKTWTETLKDYAPPPPKEVCLKPEIRGVSVGWMCW